MKFRIQAQYLQPGDIVGSGEVVIGLVINSINISINKVRVGLENHNHTHIVYWGKYTMINVERADKVVGRAEVIR